MTLIPIITGVLFCVVPSVLLMTIWIFCFFLVVDRRVTVFSSRATSTEMVNRGGLDNYVMLMIIVPAISLVPAAVPYLGFVIGWFVLPIAWLIEAAAYIQEVDENKPPLAATADY